MNQLAEAFQIVQSENDQAEDEYWQTIKALACGKKIPPEKVADVCRAANIAQEMAERHLSTYQQRIAKRKAQEHVAKLTPQLKEIDAEIQEAYAALEKAKKEHENAMSSLSFRRQSLKQQINAGRPDDTFFVKSCLDTRLTVQLTELDRQIAQIENPPNSNHKFRPYIVRRDYIPRLQLELNSAKRAGDGERAKSYSNELTTCQKIVESADKQLAPLRKQREKLVQQILKW